MLNYFYFIFILQLTFKCSGSSHQPPSSHESHVDPHTGVHLQEVTATISKDLVYEFFGTGPFKCECHAWSPRGKAKSQPATVEVACKYILTSFFFCCTWQNFTCFLILYTRVKNIYIQYSIQYYVG